nr:reverse transcriptase domain-containing protein [Tanacetum cinerariifolium]
MTDQRNMTELLRAPTEGYAEAILVPLILAEQFEIKHNLINMMTSDKFFGLEKDNLHDHIRAARRWQEEEPTRSIHTWEDLVSKLINEFFPPSRTTNLHNEILNFQQRFDESFHEAWDRYKDLLRACPHQSFTKLHQLDTFYNALNQTDQDSLNAVTGGNLLERLNQQTSAMTTAMTAMLKKFQATPPPSSVKAVKETCVTCSGAHPYYQCMANQIRPPGFAQPNVQNNQNQYGPPQGFNHGDNFNPEHSYQAPAQQNQNVHLNELEKVRRMNEANMKSMQTQIDMVKNELRNEMKNSIQTSLSNQTNEIKNLMASLLQMNTASTSGSGSLLSNTIAKPKGELKAITTRSGLVIDGPTIPTPPQSIYPEVDERVDETFMDPDLADELKCKALANLGASINLMPLSVWKKLGLPELISTRMTLELANCSICTPAGITRDVFVPVGKFTFLADFLIVAYESDPRVPFILGRPFLRTARALIYVHGEEMILRDEGSNVLSKKLLDPDCTKDLHPSIHDDPLKVEFLLYQDIDSSLKDSIDKNNLANLADNFVDSVPEMFTDEHALDYSSPPIFDEYDDEFLEVESDAENVCDDPFDSKGKKIKESKLLIDELDLPCDFLPFSEYESSISQDFSRFNVLPSTNNEDKIFNQPDFQKPNEDFYFLLRKGHPHLGYSLSPLSSLLISSSMGELGHAQ